LYEEALSILSQAKTDFDFIFVNLTHFITKSLAKSSQVNSAQVAAFNSTFSTITSFTQVCLVSRPNSFFKVKSIL
jgi:hypothetical protein